MMTLLCQIYCTALYYLFSTESGARYQHFRIWEPKEGDQWL